MSYKRRRPTHAPLLSQVFNGGSRIESSVDAIALSDELQGFRSATWSDGEDPPGSHAANCSQKSERASAEFSGRSISDLANSASSPK